MHHRITFSLVLLLSACSAETDLGDAQTTLEAAVTSRFKGISSGRDVVEARLRTVDAALGDDAQGREFLRDYARRALHPQTIRTQEHLVGVFALRDSVIAHLGPRVEPYFASETDYSVVERFVAEVALVGLEPFMAEGILFGIGRGDLLPDKVAALATEDFRLYTQFQTAKAQSVGGEYPFLDLEPQRKMILLGEELVYNHPDSPFAKSARPDFEEALLLFMSLHRAEGEQWFVGPATTAYYPWASGDEAHRAFVLENESSRFHAAVVDLLRSPSDASGEQLDIIVIATGTDEEGVRLGVIENLERGVPLLHVLSLRIEDGLTSVAVYRYFPVGDPRVQQAVSDAEGDGLDTQVFTLSRADVGL